MVTGAASQYHYPIDFTEYFFSPYTEQPGHDRARIGHHLQRVGDGHRLFEDFLLHVMLVMTELDSGCGQL